MVWPTILNLNRIAEFIRGNEQQDIGSALELMDKRHEECSKNLRNSVLTFAGFAVICWAALSKKDIDLLSVQSVVKIGVVGIEVTLDNFLAVAPLTALVLLIHGAVFRLRLNRLDPFVAEMARISTLFNLPGRPARLAAFFLHVFVPVALLAFLLVKTSNRESFQWNLPIIAVALIVVVAANLRFGRFNGATITVTLCIAVGLFAAAISDPLAKILREQITCAAPLDYREVVFRDSGINLRGGRFHCADFFRADLNAADLSNADLGGANLTDANFADADLTDANLTAADLTGAEFPNAKLMRAVFAGTNLTGTKLGGADLRNANLKFALLTFADFTRANLRGADLTRAFLVDANLTGADFTRANLTGANLAVANLRNANLTDANLTDANLTAASYSHPVTQQQLDSACISKGGKPPTLPKGLKPPQKVCGPTTR